MHTILLADIFGETAALQRFSAALATKSTIISPYDEMLDFVDEAQAYAHFMQHVGLEKYCQKVIDHLHRCNESVSVIAFSIGASAIWKISGMAYEESNAAKNVSGAATIKELAKIRAAAQIKGALCFYSSQIRHLTDLQNSFPVQLVFAKHEAQFSVSDVIKQLSSKQQLHVFRSDYLHGFMNENSKNFDQHGYQQSLKAILAVPEKSSYHLAKFDN
ncbi:MAG: hypothetical protein V7784_02255 [Oceanospirillaceae bacterium]